MTVQNKRYDNGKVVVISSKPSSARRRYTEEYMKRLQFSSDEVLKTLAEINTAYPQPGLKNS